MSDPRPTAREVHEAMQSAPHDGKDYRQARAAIAILGAASDAREDRLREALERIRDCTSRADAGGCETCQDEARAALAAIPARSDR